ncbi:MAG: DNA polymerase III subunit epsilon [Cocleimonas sp.]
MLRQVFLDTETTGLEIRDGNRIIEIGCVEMVDRKLTGNNYHQYINAGRESEEGALNVHGITTDFLADKPTFDAITPAFLEYIKGAELIIHNAPFDLGFLNNELSKLAGTSKTIEDYCEINDSLVMARQMHPGQRNSLDALCKRYDINNEHRELHGALLDSEILAEVYLAMTGGQTALLLGENAADGADASGSAGLAFNRVSADHISLPVLKANDTELEAHQKYQKEIDEASGKSLWH